VVLRLVRLTFENNRATNCSIATTLPVFFNLAAAAALS
jgi:hypothetical protein